MMRILICGHPQKTKNYQCFLQMLGFSWHVVNTYHQTQSANLFDGLLLPGGGDIAPSLFHAPNLGSRNIEKDLDEVQFRYLHDFYKEGKPILGICKGIQLINLYFGGSIYQNLPVRNQNIHTSDSSGNDRFHKVFACASSTHVFWHVNSAHHQAIDQLGHNIQVTHLAEDGIIEGICHTKKPIIGLQWHPERLLFSST